MRGDLLSPNEYLRGAALKLVAKIREQKVVEPLLEAVVKNLVRVYYGLLGFTRVCQGLLGFTRVYWGL